MCSSSRSCMRGLAAILSSRGPESLEPGTSGSRFIQSPWEGGDLWPYSGLISGLVLIGTDAAFFETCPGPVVFARGRNIFGLTFQAIIRLECLNTGFCKCPQMSHFLDFEHHFQVFVGDYNRLYPQCLGDVQLGHLPSPGTCLNCQVAGKLLVDPCLLI